MRTKIAFLTAAATVAGLLSASAQVYSVNIVGYANTTLQGNGRFSLVANPFNDGNGNNMSNILSSSLVKQSQVLTWNGVSFNIYTRVGTPPSWGLSTTNLPPGIGFFVRNGLTNGTPVVTNTWVGSLAANSGTLVTNVIVTNLNMYGSMVPFAGDLGRITTGTGDVNLNFGQLLNKQSQVLTWSGSNYIVTSKLGNPALWSATVSIAVGEGFFVNSKNMAAPTTNWVQLVP